MKTKVIFFIFFVLPYFLIAQDKTSEIINSDLTLSKVNSALPKGWYIFIENGKMTVERKDSIKAIKSYRFNSPLLKMNKIEREDYIKKEGYTCKSKIIYRIEPLWDINKIIESKNNNEAIYAKYNNLPVKHNIADLKKIGGRNSRAVYQPRNETDKKNIKAFEEEKLLLEKQIVKLPNFSTTNYSVFFISHDGYDDDNHFIFPESASVELFTIENLFRELCGK